MKHSHGGQYYFAIKGKQYTDFLGTIVLKKFGPTLGFTHHGQYLSRRASYFLEELGLSLHDQYTIHDLEHLQQWTHEQLLEKWPNLKPYYT